MIAARSDGRERPYQYSVQTPQRATSIANLLTDPRNSRVGKGEADQFYLLHITSEIGKNLCTQCATYISNLILVVTKLVNLTYLLNVSFQRLYEWYVWVPAQYELRTDSVE